VRDNALQCPIASICIRLAAMETRDRPRRDTGFIDDWDDNDTPCLLALREGAKLGDDQPLDLVFGLWDFFHDRFSVRWSVLVLVPAATDPCSKCIGTLARITVIREEIAGQIWAWRRLFRNPG
jgi:hypothetical protein